MIYVVIYSDDHETTWHVWDGYESREQALQEQVEAKKHYPEDTFEMHCLDPHLYAALRRKLAA